MRPVDVLPAIRSAAAPRELSADEKLALRALPYAEYLQSAWWRACRNRVLTAAGYRCRACGAKRDLRVRHVSLEHLGAEADADLEVLCGGCVESRDVPETHDGVAVYARVVSAILREQRLTHFSDIVEEAKRRCVAARIPYHTEEFRAAIARLVPRFPADDIPPPGPAQAPAGDRPLSRAEAAEILASLDAAGLIKRMPAAPLTSRRAAARRIAAKQIAALILDQVQRCEEADAAAAKHERRTDTTGT